MSKPNIDYNAPDAEWYDGVPRSISRLAIFGLSLMIISFGGFGLWAFQAPLAAAVIAQGSFVATGQNKIVQHFEGGIIRDILVQEGDQVEAGQMILRLDETAASASERELTLRLTRLEATEARLIAEYENAPRISFPARLLASADDFEVATIIESQELAFRVSRSALENDISLLQTNIDALKIRASGYEAQLETSKAQLDLLQTELEMKLELETQGLTRRAEFVSLRRTILEATGQIGRLRAQVEEISKVKLKHEKQVKLVLSEFSEAVLDELQKVQAELDVVREKLRAAQSVRDRVDVSSPVTGTVVRMHYHTAGGVIESGRPIAEILPVNEDLIIEVQIPRVDIDSVKAGQPATVRLTALNQRTTPVLDGKVFYISADAITDTSTGTVQEVYIARISLGSEELSRVAGFSPTPGMPAEIMIQTAERTFAQYIAKPIKDSMIRAFREQ